MLADSTPGNGMFGQALLDSALRRRSRWPAALAYGCESIALAAIFLAPVLSKIGLPEIAAPRSIMPLGSAASPASTQPSGGGRHGVAISPRSALQFDIRPARASLPFTHAGDQSAAGPDRDVSAVIGAGPLGNANGIPGSLLAATPATPNHPPEKLRRIHVSELDRGHLER